MLARGNRDVRSHAGGKLCEYHGINCIGLCMLTHCSSEIPGLFRVDDCNRQTCVGAGDQKRLLETTGVLARDQCWFELLDVLLDPKAAPSGLGRLTNCLIPFSEFSNSRISPVGKIIRSRRSLQTSTPMNTSFGMLASLERKNVGLQHCPSLLIELEVLAATQPRQVAV
jgi:hypothetical protein